MLDVATGPGYFIQVVLENLKEYDEITGIDTDGQYATKFPETFQGSKFQFIQMDASKMDFPRESFDTVCISNSLHHMTDLSQTLAEMKRVLKPGGHFIINEMFCNGQSETQLTHVMIHHWCAAIDTALGIPHEETFTREQIIALAREVHLSNLVFYDIADLDEDPKDPELIQDLNTRIDRYLQRAKGLSNVEALASQAEDLLWRLGSVGFHSATALLVVGEK